MLHRKDKQQTLLGAVFNSLSIQQLKIKINISINTNMLFLYIDIYKTSGVSVDRLTVPCNLMLDTRHI